MSKNIVELNGNTYDVRTGKMISSARPTPMQPQMDIAKPAKRQVDSYRQDRRLASQPVSKSMPAPPRTKKSQTLMRTAVQKPQPVNNDDSAAGPQAQKRQTPSHHSRFERAKKIAKSAAIKKFHLTSQESANNSQQQTVVTNQPIQKQQNTQLATQTNQIPTSNQKSPSSNQQQSQNRLEAAVAEATSHEQTFEEGENIITRTLTRLRAIPVKVRYGFAVVVAIFALGTAGYLFAPRASVQLAANRSGVAASLPAYRPAGFTLNRSVDYSPGQVTLQFDSLTDNRNFRIHKASTDWTSEALRANFVEERGLYQTVENRGNTVFIYNGTNATWVDGGIWYTIEGASSLNSNQLLRIAESL